MHSIHLEQVALDRIQLQPPVAHEATESTIYFVLEGSCAVRVADELSLRLNAGDLGIVPHVAPHRVEAMAAPGPSVSPTAELMAFRFLAGGDSMALARLRPLQLQSGSSHAAAWVRRLAPLLTVSAPDRISTAAYRHLAEAILCQAIDDVDATRVTGQKPQDDDVLRVIELMRAQPERKWTIDSLAREVSISRSSLADRFTFALRQPPMEYLHQLRMQRTESLLGKPNYEIKRIAAAVGYRSIAAFSHAFRRWSGRSPSVYRKKLTSSLTN